MGVLFSSCRKQVSHPVTKTDNSRETQETISDIELGNIAGRITTFDSIPSFFNANLADADPELQINPALQIASNTQVLSLSSETRDHSNSEITTSANLPKNDSPINIERHESYVRYSINEFEHKVQASKSISKLGLVNPPKVILDSNTADSKKQLNVKGLVLGVLGAVACAVFAVTLMLDDPKRNYDEKTDTSQYMTDAKYLGWKSNLVWACAGTFSKYVIMGLSSYKVFKFLYKNENFFIPLEALFPVMIPESLFSLINVEIYSWFAIRAGSSIYGKFDKNIIGTYIKYLFSSTSFKEFKEKTSEFVNFTRHFRKTRSKIEIPSDFYGVLKLADEEKQSFYKCWAISSILVSFLLVSEFFLVDKYFEGVEKVPLKSFSMALWIFITGRIAGQAFGINNYGSFDGQNEDINELCYWLISSVIQPYQQYSLASNPDIFYYILHALSIFFAGLIDGSQSFFEIKKEKLDQFIINRQLEFFKNNSSLELEEKIKESLLPYLSNPKINKSYTSVKEGILITCATSYLGISLWTNNSNPSNSPFLNAVSVMTFSGFFAGYFLSKFSRPKKIINTKENGFIADFRNVCDFYLNKHLMTYQAFWNITAKAVFTIQRTIEYDNPTLYILRSFMGFMFAVGAGSFMSDLVFGKAKNSFKSDDELVEKLLLFSSSENKQFSLSINDFNLIKDILSESYKPILDEISQLNLSLEEVIFYLECSKNLNKKNSSNIELIRTKLENDIKNRVEKKEVKVYKNDNSTYVSRITIVFINICIINIWARQFPTPQLSF